MIGLRFSADQLALLDGEAELGELIAAELVDQVVPPARRVRLPAPADPDRGLRNTGLKSDRVALHRRLATAMNDATLSLDENAVGIAERQAADDLRAAFGWHMRAGGMGAIPRYQGPRERARGSPRPGCPPMTRAGRGCASPRGLCCA